MLFDSIAATMLLAADDPTFFTSLLATITSIAKVALGIGLVIFVHELGHFAAAKLCGVKCEKFYVGFDPPIQIGPIKFPRSLGKFTYGETEYGVGIIPLGGYVKMLGQDDDPRKMEEENQRIRQETGDDDAEVQLDPRSFPAQPVWQRMIIISAGVVMNVVTGVIFAAIAFGFGVPYTPAIVGGVTPGGPAWQAGVRPGGQVTAVDQYEAEAMHFREMQTEILSAGIEDSDKPVDITVRYDDGPRNFALRTQERPELSIVRLIGVSPPTSTSFSKSMAADPGSVAAEALTEKDKGATVVAFDGVSIDPEAIVPATPLLHHLYTNPTKTISLTLRRTDDTEVTVDIPPQQAKSIGVRFAIGPIIALAKDGAAEQAGMKLGDRIVRVGDNNNPTAFALAIELVGPKESIAVTVERDGNEVELLINPTDSLQTIPPTSGITGEIAINAVGFAYQPLTKIAAIDTTAEQPEGFESLEVGDTIKKVLLSDEEAAKLTDPKLERIVEELKKGWTFTPKSPLRTLREAFSMMPVGTKLTVHATRGAENKVVTSLVEIQPSEEYMFRRGLALLPTESIQTAESFTDAFALGIKEGKRRFGEVTRFLGNLVSGNIGLNHVGGPVAIFAVAKSEADQGISRLLMFLTFLSMNLAILNFLPIPMLDGGHIVFLLYELIAGKRANEHLEYGLTVAGLVMLLMLMVFVFANDIMRLIG